MANRFQRELALLVTGQDVSASKTLRNVDRQIVGLHNAAGKAGTHLARNIERGVLLGAGAATGALAFAANAAMDWESAFAGVAKTVEGDVTAIGEGIREMATEIPVAATELAAIAEAGGALGVAKEDLLDFTKTVALLGETTDLSTDAAATSLGHLKTTIGLTGSEFETFGNTLVSLGNTGASTESDILAMAENVAGAASLIGLSKDQLLGWSAALANTGEEAEAGGTTLQRFFLGTQKAVAAGGKDLAKFAKVSGKSAKQFKRDWEEDASGALEDLIVHLGTLSEAEQLAALDSLGFDDIRITRGLLKLVANTDNLTDSLDNSAEAWRENNAMTVEAEKRFKTTQSQIDLLKNNLTEAAIVVGSELLPVITELAAEGVDWLKGHQPEIAQFAKDLAAGIRDTVTWARSLDWNAISTALQAGAGFAKNLVDAFVGAPPWLQQFLAVGFVANKFTGGAIGDVFKGLASGLIKGVLGMNAGVVHIKAGTVVGGGGPGLPGAGAATGLTAGVIGAAGVGVVILGVTQAVSASLAGSIATAITGSEKVGGAVGALQTSTSGGSPIPILGPLDRWIRALQGDFRSGVEVAEDIALETKNVGQYNREAAQAQRETAARQNIANERLDAIRGYTQSESQRTSTLLASNERNEAITHQKQDQTARQIAAGDTRTELQIGRQTSRMITDSASERAAIARAGTVAAGGGDRAASAIKNKRMSVTVNANTTVSIRDLGKQFTYKQKSGMTAL